MQRRKRAVTIGAVGAIAFAVSAGGYPALAAPHPEPSDQPQISVQQLPAEEPEVVPAVGETVVVVEHDGITTYYGISASCTESITAYTPTKSGGSARASLQFQRSSGCSGTVSRTARLQWQGFLGAWQDRGNKTSSAAPGTNTIILVSYPCQNSNATVWRSLGLYGSVGNPTTSSAVTLTCGG